MFGWNIAWGMKDSRSQHTLIMECIEHTACAFPVAYCMHDMEMMCRGKGLKEFSCIDTLLSMIS